MGRPFSHPAASQRTRRKDLQAFLLSVPRYGSLNMPSSTRASPTLFTSHRWQSPAAWHSEKCQGQDSPKAGQSHAQQWSQATSGQVFSTLHPHTTVHPYTSIALKSVRASVLIKQDWDTS